MDSFRMCISCKKLKPKKDLIRIVRDNNGNLDIDTSYKMQTRGTYICKNFDCILNLKKSNKLKKQFKLDESFEFYDRLEKFVEN